MVANSTSKQRADYERAREIDAAFAALPRQRDALLAACEAAANKRICGPANKS